MEEETNDSPIDPKDQELVNKEKWKNLPGFVALNPRKAGIFLDDRSGLTLSQFSKNYDNVPKTMDCSRIAMALMNGNLIECNPKGESKYIRPDKFEVNSQEKSEGKTQWDKLMSMHSRELVIFINNTRDAALLNKMRQLEEVKPQRERRVTVLQAISERLKSRDVVGIVMSVQPNMIQDKKTGKMVVDTVSVLR